MKIYLFFQHQQVYIHLRVYRNQKFLLFVLNNECNAAYAFFGGVKTKNGSKRENLEKNSFLFLFGIPARIRVKYI